MIVIKEVLGKTNYQWVTIANYNLAVSDLLNSYSIILIKLFNTADVTVKQYQLQEFTGINLITGSLSLANYIKYHYVDKSDEISPIKKNTLVNRAPYHDIWKYSVNVNRGNHGDSVVGESYFKPDLAVYRDDETLAAFNRRVDNLLFSVNGMIYFDYTKNKVSYLKKAGLYSDYFISTQMGAIDFSNVGGITKIPLTTDNTTLFHSDNKSAIFHVSTTSDLSNINFLVVINGRLHIFDSSYQVLNASTIAIKINYDQVIKELVNIPNTAVSWIDSIRIDGDGWVINSIDPLDYITQGNSGLVILATNEIAIREVVIMPTRFTHRYRVTANSQHDGILFLSDGTLAEYNLSAITGYGKLISSTLPKLKKPLINTTIFNNLTGVTTSSLAFKSEPSIAKMLHLYQV